MVSLMQPSEFEDMSSQHRRYRRRSGTMDACIMPSERSMPKRNAPGAAWVAWHQERVGEGGFDPASLLRRSA